MAILEIRDIHKRFGNAPGVLNGIDLDICDGEIACLLGPSGCGKTTLLRIIAGLERPHRGQVLFEGRDILSVAAHRRGFGLMFQDYALFPHKDVTANIAFGLRMQGRHARQIEQRVQELLDLVNLQGLAHRDVSQLSGGEQQRVALARSLAPQPRLLMLDEPIGALDRTLRDRLLEELGRVLRQVGITVLYVTHDQSEAFAIADRVILMRDGQIVQAGAPEAVYRHPANVWAACFLGMHNLVPAAWISPGYVSTDLGTLAVSGRGEGSLTVLIRPDAATVGRSEGGTVVHATLSSRSFRGPLVHIAVRGTGKREFVFDLPIGAEMPPIGEQIALTLRREGIVCLQSEPTPAKGRFSVRG